MSAQLSDRLTRRWVRAYTRPLPPEARDGRRAEVDSDLWEHRDETRERGLNRTLTSLEVTARLLAGVPADLAWRHSHLRAARDARRSTRIERNLMTETIALPKFGYPTWLAILAAVMGGFAIIVGTVGAIEYLTDSGDNSDGWGFLALAVGAVLLAALWLARRAPLASVLLMVFGGLVFGLLMWWIVVPILMGIAVAIGAVLSAPRLLGARPSA